MLGVLPLTVLSTKYLHHQAQHHPNSLHPLPRRVHRLLFFHLLHPVPARLLLSRRRVHGSLPAQVLQLPVALKPDLHALLIQVPHMHPRQRKLCDLLGEQVFVFGRVCVGMPCGNVRRLSGRQ